MMAVDDHGFGRTDADAGWGDSPVICQSRRLALNGVVAMCVLAAVVGCSSDVRLDADRLEADVAQALADTSRRSVNDVQCKPDRIDKKPGTTVACTAEVEAVPVNLKVTIGDDGVAEVTDVPTLFDTTELETLAAASIATQGATADCGEAPLVELSNGLACEFTDSTFTGSTATISWTQGEAPVATLKLAPTAVVKIVHDTVAVDVPDAVTTLGTIDCPSFLTIEMSTETCTAAIGNAVTDWTVTYDDAGVHAVTDVPILAPAALEARLVQQIGGQLGEVAISCGADDVIVVDSVSPTTCIVTVGTDVLSAEVLSTSATDISWTIS